MEAVERAGMNLVLLLNCTHEYLETLFFYYFESLTPAPNAAEENTFASTANKNGSVNTVRVSVLGSFNILFAGLASC
jgi:hypothetical protein